MRCGTGLTSNREMWISTTISKTKRLSFPKETNTIWRLRSTASNLTSIWAILSLQLKRTKWASVESTDRSRWLLSILCLGQTGTRGQCLRIQGWAKNHQHSQLTNQKLLQLTSTFRRTKGLRLSFNKWRTALIRPLVWKKEMISWKRSRGNKMWGKILWSFNTLNIKVIRWLKREASTRK